MSFRIHNLVKPGTVYRRFLSIPQPLPFLRTLSLSSRTYSSSSSSCSLSSSSVPLFRHTNAALLTSARRSESRSSVFSSSSPLRYRGLLTRYQSTSSSSSSSSTSSLLSSTLTWIRTHVTLKNLKLYWPQILAGGGALIVLYGISSASVHIATVLLELDMKEVFYMGFLTGVFTSLGLGLVGLRVYRNITIQPDAVYRYALYKLARNSVIRGELGNQIRSGSLKAYVIQPGHFTMQNGVRWVEPRIQMLFQVVGDKNEGMATCEAVKHKGSLAFSVLALDTLAKPNKPSILILVAGKEEKLHVRGTLRGFLQTERAQYVVQDRSENDDDLIAEQSTLEVDTNIPDILNDTTIKEDGSTSSGGDKAKLQ